MRRAQNRRRLGRRRGLRRCGGPLAAGTMRGSPRRATGAAPRGLMACPGWLIGGGSPRRDGPWRFDAPLGGYSPRDVRGSLPARPPPGLGVLGALEGGRTAPRGGSWRPRPESPEGGGV